MRPEREQQQASVPRDSRVVTPRQQAILLLIKDGKTNSEIAQVLGCSQWTVKNHIQRILRKLQVSNRAQAVGRCLATHVFAGEEYDKRQ